MPVQNLYIESNVQFNVESQTAYIYWPNTDLENGPTIKIENSSKYKIVSKTYYILCHSRGCSRKYLFQLTGPKYWHGPKKLYLFCVIIIYSLCNERYQRKLVSDGAFLCFFVFIFPLGEKRMTKSNRYTKGLTDFGWGWGGGGTQWCKTPMLCNQ